ncbi:DMT family transporter, partial [Clavibacter michiganensis]|uniref:DMT family transporter n=1 Tax=Clavibacter michiganensis TaxID=28447 RepID=UPI00292FCEF9
MASRTRPEPVVDLLLLAVAAVWGASFLAAKDLAAETGVPAAVALRFLVAAGATGLVCVARRERLPRGRGLLIAAALGCSQAAVIGLETWGVHLTSATNAGLLISLALVMTPVLEGAASRSWLPRSYFVAAVAAVVGVALLVSEGGLRAPTPGDGLVIAAAVVRAVHVTASGRLTRGRSEGSLGVVLVQMAVCAALFSAMAGPDLPAAAAALDAPGWAGVLFLGVLCSLFAFAVQLWAVRRTSASRASILMGTEPVWALLVCVVVAGETIGPVGAGGAALIVAASYAGQAIERRHRARIGAAVGGRGGGGGGRGRAPPPPPAPRPAPRPPPPPPRPPPPAPPLGPV